MEGPGAPPRAEPGEFRIENLPLFPLNSVLFPGGRLPLRIFEQRYMDMAKTCLKDGSPFGVCLIREGAEVGAPAVPNDIGTLAKIVDWDMAQLGVLQVTARGEQRFRIRSRSVQRDGLARATVELLPEESDGPIPPDAARCAKILERIIEQHPRLLERPHRLDSCAWVSARLAELLPLPNETKQAMLELDDGRARLQRLNGLVRSD
jgi:uncharacterized protein